MSRRWSRLIVVGVSAALGCGGNPYGEERLPDGNKTAPDPQTSGAAAAPSGPAQGGSTPSGSTPGGSTPANSTSTASEVVLAEDFEGAPKFSVAHGTLTLVPNPTGGRMGRVCMDASGSGAIEAKIGPSQPGTYVFSASVRADPEAPAVKWSLEATHFAPAPIRATNDGALSAIAETVSTTKVVASAPFTSKFAVLLGLAPGTCMLVDDIRVVRTP